MGAYAGDAYAQAVFKGMDCVFLNGKPTCPVTDIGAEANGVQAAEIGIELIQAVVQVVVAKCSKNFRGFV